MKALARSYVWWPGMDNEIENTVKSCKSCQINHTMPAKAPVHPWEKTTSPWVRLHIDFAGSFMDKMFFIIYDSYSKWINVIPMKKIKTVLVISCLRNVFSTHGIPCFLVSDNGTSFSSQEFDVFCKLNGIKNLKISPYHPSSNGAAERSVQTFKTALKKIVEGKEINDLDSTLSHFMLSYRTTPHSTTGISPAELLFNRKLNTRLNFVKPKLSNIINDQEQKFKQFNNYSSNLRQFYPGDNVWVRNYSKTQAKLAEGKIIEKIGNIMYKIQLTCKTIVIKHVDQLCYKPDIDELNDNELQNLKPQCDKNVTDVSNEYDNQTVIPSNSTISLQPEHHNESDQSKPAQQPSSTIPNHDTNPEIKNSSQPIINEPPKRNRRQPAYLEDYET